MVHKQRGWLLAGAQRAPVNRDKGENAGKMKNCGGARATPFLVASIFSVREKVISLVRGNMNDKLLET